MKQVEKSKQSNETLTLQESLSDLKVSTDVPAAAEKKVSDEAAPRLPLTLESLLKDYPGESMRFDLFSDMRMIYTGFVKGIRMEFSISPKIKVTKAMSLQNLWDAVKVDLKAAAPAIEIEGKTVDLASAD